MQFRRILGFALLLVPVSASGVVVTVSPSNLGPWRRGPMITCSLTGVQTGTLDFPAGSSPPLGGGSVRFDIGSNGDTLLVFGDNSVNDVPLASLTELSYSTFVGAAQSHATSQQAPALLLSIDVNGNATQFDQLIFQPRFQTGAFSGDPVPNQGPVLLGVWQQWNALAGGWYSIFNASGPPLTTLASYVAAHPLAKVESLSQLGLAIIVGCHGTNWQLFSGRVDALNVAVLGAVTTFDFEPDPPPPAIPTLSVLGAIVLGVLLLGVAIRRL